MQYYYYCSIVVIILYGLVMSKTAEKYIKTWKQLKQDRYNFENLWQEIANYIAPNDGDFTRFYSIGQRRQNYIFDNTGQHSLKLFASSVIGLLSNPSAKWFTLETTNEELNQDSEISAWLELASDITLSAFNEASAKFYGNMYEALISYGAFGTAGMLVQSGDDTMLQFKAYTPRALWIAEDSNGNVNVVYNLKEYTISQLVDKQQSADWSLSTAITDRVGDGNMHGDKVKVLHIVEPNPDYKAGNIDDSGKRYQGIYLDVDNSKIMFQEYYTDKPILVGRWEKVFNEVYGRSPAMEALPNVRLANSMAKAHMVAAEKIINPPLQVRNEGTYGQINLSAGAVNFSDGDITPISDIGNIPLTLEMQEAVRNEIRKSFFIDQLQMVGTTQMTATEVLQRQDERARLIAPAIGMIQSELLGPVVGRAMQILMDDGHIPPAPARMKEVVGDPSLNVSYVSPLTRAQRSSEATSIVDFIGIVGQMAQTDPNVLTRIDSDGAVKELHDIMGVPSDVLRSDDEVAAIANQQAEQQQMQQEMAMAGDAAQVAKTANEAGVL